MSTRELLNYAKENGFDSVTFEVIKDGKHWGTGKFLDAYFEFVLFPAISEGFFTLGDLENTLGYDITYKILSEKEYKQKIVFDFLIRGKEVPEEYTLTDDSED